jgi:hypothetical protein
MWALGSAAAATGRRRLLAGAFTLASIVVAPGVRAQGPNGPSASSTTPTPPTPQLTEDERANAQKEFAEGMRAYKAGDYKHAAESFEAAYKHKPHYSALWNAARARQKTGDLARAANLYAHYLREAPPNARDRDTAQQNLKQIEPRLGQIEIHASGFDDVAVDQEAASPNGNVYVNPGEHIVEAKKEDKSVRESRAVQAGQVVSVALVAPAPGAALVAVPPPLPAPPPERHGWSPVVAYALGGATVAAAGVAVWSGVDTLHQRTAFDKDPSQDNLEQGRSKQLRTNILVAVSAGLALGTGVAAVWLVDWQGSGAGTVRAGFGPGSVHVAGSF